MATAYEISVNGSGPDRPLLSDAPATVSVRRHLRDGVPDIYRRNHNATRDQPPPFAMRFLHALEEVLDPIVATLDSLPAHLDADLAPEHALEGLASWLGVDEVESLPPDQRREAVRRAGELGRLRGTRAGLQLALSLFFPAISMRINDHGGVVVGESADDAPPPASAASFEVMCDQSLPPETQMAVARTIERWKPVHAHYKLRVKRGDKVRTLPEVPRASSADDPGVTPEELRPPFGPGPNPGRGPGPVDDEDGDDAA
jgi:phage tail-like protein